MAEAGSYRYAVGDPRQDRSRYMYPPFEPDLISSHAASRRAMLDRLVVVGDSLSRGAARRPAVLPPPDQGEVRTGELLEACAQAGPGSALTSAWVDLMARKFETARVLRASYGADLRPVDRTDAGPDGYAHLAELLSRLAARDDLGALSTLLKLTDYLDWVTARGEPEDGLSSIGAVSAVRAVETEMACLSRLPDLQRRDSHPEPLGSPERPAPSEAAANTTRGPGVLPGVGLLAAETGRARAYVDLLVGAGLSPAAAVVVDSPGASAVPGAVVPTPLFDNITPLGDALVRAGVPTTAILADRLDAPAVVAAVAALPPIVIVAAPAGVLLGRAFFELAGKRYLHVHPGRLPDYRGSTPMYYQLLAEGRLTATALILEEKIDTGPIVAERDFAPPADRSTIDLAFDPWMRAVTLRDVLSRVAAGAELPGRRQPSGGRTYFVIHPVLRHIAMQRG